MVSSHVYEIIRTIYNTTQDSSEDARIPVLQQTLSQLRLTNIATLDACMNHFTRLIELTSADEEYVAKLATTLAPCILRPRTETSLTMEEKHAYRLIRDLFAHKDAIFSELKRMSTLGASASISGNNNRPRAISTDESNRRAHMEERNRLILEKANGGRSRATSPAPGPRAHRRDRSVGGPETRFPISPSGITSPTSSQQHGKRPSLGPVLPKRSSLEVPDETGASLSHPADGNLNGAAPAEAGTPKSETADPLADKRSSLVEKRNSLGRSGARISAGRRIPVVASTTAASQQPSEKENSAGHGHAPVTLTDAPMDY